MSKCTPEDKKNAGTKREHSVPQVPDETSQPTETFDRTRGNGKSRRSVEGPEDYVSHDTDDLK